MARLSFDAPVRRRADGGDCGAEYGVVASIVRKRVSLALMRAKRSVRDDALSNRVDELVLTVLNLCLFPIKLIRIQGSEHMAVACGWPARWLVADTTSATSIGPREAAAVGAPTTARLHMVDSSWAATVAPITTRRASSAQGATITSTCSALEPSRVAGPIILVRDRALTGQTPARRRTKAQLQGVGT